MPIALAIASRKRSFVVPYPQGFVFVGETRTDGAMLANSIAGVVGSTSEKWKAKGGKPEALLTKLKRFACSGSISSFACAYTVLFFILFALIFGPMPLAGQSFVWVVDGLMQHYPFFVYEGEWLRGIISSFLEGSPRVTLWDPGMGYGADIIITLGAYIGDPLNLLSVFAGPAQAEVLYSSLVVLRLYLAGLAFVGFMRSRGYGLYAVMLGAASYAFCGWASTSMSHSFFIYPMIFFPLLLWGADGFFEKGKPTLFVISVAGFFLTYFYFGYMACIFLAPYCLYRAWQHEGGWKMARIAVWAVKFILFLLLGIAISAVILFPILSTLLGSERLALERSLPPIYPLTTLAPLVAGFSGGVAFVGKDTYFGTSAVCVFAAVMLLASKDKRILKVGLLVLVIGAFLPIFGKVMNGFAYYAERWTWVLSFLLVYLQVRETQKMLRPDKRSLILLGIVGVILIVGVLVGWVFSRRFYTLAPAICMLLVLAYALVSFRNARPGKHAVNPKWERANKGILFGVSILCVLIANWGFWYAGWSAGAGRQVEEMPFGQAYQTYYGEIPDDLIIERDHDSFWRYDKTFSTPGQMNLPALRGVQSSEFYSSLHNSFVDQFNTSMGITSSHANSQMANLRSRSWLESFLGMKYFIAPTNNDALLPYGVSSEPLETMVSSDTEYGLYENELALGLVTQFSKEYISESEYYSMGMASRQEVLFSNVVMGSGQTSNDNGVPASDYLVEADAKEIPFAIADHSEGITVAESNPSSYEFVVMEPNSTLKLEFEGNSDSDTFVQIENVSFNSNPTANDPSSHREGIMGIVDALKDWKNGIGEEYMIFFSREDIGVMDFIDGVTPDSHVYGGKDDWLVNLGSKFQGPTSVTLTFREAGAYTIGDMKVVSISNEALTEKARQLQAKSLEVTSSANSYVFSREEEGPCTVLATIAWSKGWSAKVDGNDASLMRGDIAFLAIALDEGEHVIELKYETPYLRAGAVVSCLAIVLLVGIACYGKRLRRE